MENPNYKTENIEQKFLKIMQKNQFLKVKNSPLKLEKGSKELKDIELEDRQVKIKREIEELFLKPIAVSIDDMDSFEKNEMKKVRPVKNTWYDQQVNYISQPIRKITGDFKDKVVSLFNTSTTKQTVYRRGKITKETKQTKETKRTKETKY